MEAADVLFFFFLTCSFFWTNRTLVVGRPNLWQRSTPGLLSHICVGPLGAGLAARVERTLPAAVYSLHRGATGVKWKPFENQRPQWEVGWQSFSFWSFSQWRWIPPQLVPPLHSTHPLPMMHMKVGGEIQTGEGLHACSSQFVVLISPSDVFAFQEVGPLQHFDVTLVDFEGGAESDREAGQHVAALHQEEGFPINFLLKREKSCFVKESEWASWSRWSARKVN